MNRSLTLVLLSSACLLLVGVSCSVSLRTSKHQDGGVFESEDGGNTWIQVVAAGVTAKKKPVLIDGVNIQFIRFDPNNPSTIYAGTQGLGIYRMDRGATEWVKTGLALGTFPAFAIDPTSSSVMYAGSGGIITKSSDGGAHWSTIYLESKPDRAITDLLVKPDSPSNVIAATNKGEFLLSRDYGNTWQILSTLSIADAISRIYGAPGSFTTFYVLTKSNGLYKSLDSGSTWQPLRQGLEKFPGATAITSTAFIPNQANTLYIASGYGLLQTDDGGTTWKPIQTLVPFASQPIQHVAVNPVNQNIIYVLVGNKLRKSVDGGRTWNAKISIPTTRLISTMTIDPQNPEHIYVGTIKPPRK